MAETPVLAEQLKGENVVSFSETDLWHHDDNADNWILTAGKVQLVVYPACLGRSSAVGHINPLTH